MKQTRTQKNSCKLCKKSVDKEDDERKNLFIRNEYSRLHRILYKHRKYYKDMFQKNNMAMLIIDSDNGNVINSNLIACKLYGYSKSEFRKLKITHIDTSSNKEVIKKLKQSLKRHFQKFYSKHRLSNKEIRNVEIHSGPLKMLGERIVYFIVEDITERVRLENELRKSEIQYKKLFNYANDALFLGEVNEDGTPKCFIDVNNRACELLRYSKEEILKKSPNDICSFEDYKNKFINDCVNNITKKRAKFETTAIVRDGSRISIEMSVHVFKLNKKIVFFTIVRDITKRKWAEEKIFRNSKLLEGVLEGITDIIGVCNADGRVMFYNQAGYDFFKINRDEINNRKCYEMLYRKEKCTNCPIEKIIETKKIIRMEKYIQELDKYMDCCCNPVFDDSGKVMYIINQLRDITERKNLENNLKENEERYRQIVNLLPDVIVITVDRKISLANKEAYKYFDNLIGESIYRFFPGFSEILNKRIKQILEDKRVRTVFDYRVVLDDNRVLDVEVSSSYLKYQGNPAILSIIREITKRKKDLNSAASMQKQLFKKPFNIKNKVKMETLYIPAKTVSGDFFYLSKISEDLLIGIIGDVSGKGITAALSISAFNVLFHEAILTSDQPYEILNSLNKKVGNYLGERYVAACCFRFDFRQKEVRIVGAGINQFIFQSRMKKCERKIVKGPFLGMFENSVFDEQIIRFNSGDRFYFFTDGLDFVFDDDNRNDIMLRTQNISNFTRNLKQSLNRMLIDVEGIQDDCTMIAMEIN